MLPEGGGPRQHTEIDDIDRSLPEKTDRAPTDDSPINLPNYNDHVTGVPPPVEAHGYKVELEKPFVCVADGQLIFHDICKAIDILSFYPENKRARDNVYTTRQMGEAYTTLPNYNTPPALIRTLDQHLKTDIS